MQANTNQITTIMKALGDENRLKILNMLQSGSLCACEILSQLHVSQSTLSHHMSILSEAGLVSAWPVGKWTHYRLCPQGFELAQSFLSQLRAGINSQPPENAPQISAIPPCTCAKEPKTEMSLP